jgi:gamma-glutamyltranspeptidase / glutathione hydrolase
MNYRLNTKKSPAKVFFLWCVGRFISRYISGFVFLFLSTFSLLLSAQTVISVPSASAVSTAHPLATRVGLDILQSGGNAFDAAIAVSAVLGVVEPYSSGLGGGGFWLLYQASTGRSVMLDGREKAPLLATPDMYRMRGKSSLQGGLAAGIPGVPAALDFLAKHYARLPLKRNLAAAIDYAREGFFVDRLYVRYGAFRRSCLLADSEASKIFLRGAQVPHEGARIIQRDLAETLEKISALGRKGFYQGSVAEKLVSGVSKSGGIWTLQDLKDYQVVLRDPVQGEYRGATITTAALPSSGGIVLLEILNILKQYSWESLSPVKRKHVLIEAMRRAYHDRARYLGDSDFIKVPIKQLLSADYAAGLSAAISLNQALPSQFLPGVKRDSQMEGDDTTHFSILDKDGNRVAATLSINYPFGACVVPQGTGVLLNDEMDDFVTSQQPNAYGLVGNHSNAIEPGKRPLSSMTPTFVETDQHVAILGTPGGSRIITSVLLAILDMLEGSPPEYWVSRARFHHQYLPDQIFYEEGAFSQTEQQVLEGMGHQFASKPHSIGNMQAILWDKKHQRVSAASDPSGLGLSLVE